MSWEDARSFQQKMILQAGRPSLDELRLQMGMAAIASDFGKRISMWFRVFCVDVL